MKIIFLCIMGFVAAIVDAIAGGSGLITIPAYMIAGLDPHVLLGTNKFASVAGTSMSTYTYARSDKIDWSLMLKLAPFSLIGASLGVYTVLKVDSTILEPIILVILILVGIYTMMKKDIGLINNYQGFDSTSLKKGIIVALVLGFYDGFFGPGTGTFIIFSLIKVFGFSFVMASANSKVLNLSSNFMSLILFAINKKINYSIGIPVAISMMLGAFVGSRLVVDKGDKFVKPIFIIMALAAAVKVLYGMVF